jgi:effector-binding domain-containing protein
MNPTLKTVPAMLLFCVSEEVTPEEIAPFAQRAVEPLFNALAKSGRKPAGNLEFICPEWIGPEAKSKIVFGIPVASEFPTEAPYYFWKAPAFKCASTEYKGPMSGIKDAWMNFGTEVGKAGYQAVNSWREVYIHWVAPESEEDVTELQLGIE